MRYLKQISTGKYVASQSGGDPAKSEHLQTMIDNHSANEGIDPSDLEAGYMSDDAYAGVVRVQEDARELSDWASTLAEAKTKRKREIRRGTRNKFESNTDALYLEYYRGTVRGTNPIAPGSTVTAYEDALKAALVSARQTIDTMTDIAAIKDFNATWPADL